MRRSNLDNFSKEEIVSIVDSSNSMTEAITKLGYKKGCHGPLETLEKFLKQNGLESNFLALKERAKANTVKLAKNLNKKRDNDYNNEEIFTENSMFQRITVRRRILKYNLIPYQCAECGITNSYNDKPLSLQLDHINGINDDNRLENLRWLCPNCHSQTETFTSKDPNKIKTKQREQKIKVAKKEIEKKILIEERKKYFDSIDTMKYGWISKAEKDLGISHTQIRRWINKYYPELKRYQRGK